MRCTNWQLGQNQWWRGGKECERWVVIEEEGREWHEGNKKKKKKIRSNRLKREGGKGGGWKDRNTHTRPPAIHPSQLVEIRASLLSACYFFPSSSLAPSRYSLLPRSPRVLSSAGVLSCVKVSICQRFNHQTAAPLFKQYLTDWGREGGREGGGGREREMKEKPREGRN